MSEPINANPTILDSTALPTRSDSLSSEKSTLKPLNPTLDSLLQLIIPSQQHTPLEAPELTDDSELEDEDQEDDEEEEELDAQEVFDLIAHISDPEHPLTLGQLAVVNLPDIRVLDSGNKAEMAEVVIRITPTITHCSLATLIGLGIRVRLERCLPVRYRITILLKEGSHQSENQVNKQLNDKERVAAACENEQLLSVISKMLATCK